MLQGGGDKNARPANAGPGFPLRRSWCTVHPKDRYPTPVTELFLRFVRELLPELNAHFKAPLVPAPGPSFACTP